MLSGLSFRDLVVLLPIAVTIHVAEEWRRFPEWARRFASPRYSDREYVVTHVAAIASALGTALLVRAFPRPWMVFATFAFVIGPGIFCNAFFHAGATLRWQTYCPGVVTGLFVYFPLAFVLGALAVREALISGPSLFIVVPLAIVLHTLEVGHNVFKRW